MIIEDRGRERYEITHSLQIKLRDNLIIDKTAPEYLLLVEHEPVYTLGFHGNASNLLIDNNQLKELNAKCIRIERGGDITYHGPGQLVVYPIINLIRRNLGVKKYVHLLETGIIELLEQYDIKASTSSEEIGVWVDYGTPDARKICAIGIKVSRGVTMHGLALNVNTQLDAFSNIIPCGIRDKAVTSIKNEKGKEISFENVKKQLKEILSYKLGI